jgi:hypothetical protein
MAARVLTLCRHGWQLARPARADDVTAVKVCSTSDGSGDEWRRASGMARSHPILARLRFDPPLSSSLLPEIPGTKAIHCYCPKREPQPTGCAQSCATAEMAMCATGGMAHQPPGPRLLIDQAPAANRTRRGKTCLTAILRTSNCATALLSHMISLYPASSMLPPFACCCGEK